MLKFHKKSMSTVLASMLLLLVAVIFLSMYVRWTQTYVSIQTSEFYESLEDVELVKYEDPFLYVKNYNTASVSFTKILIEFEQCVLSGTIASGISTINLSSCTIPDQDVVSFSVVGNNDIISAVLPLS